MSLFPRFTQEFAPLFRLMDDYDQRTSNTTNNSFSTFRKSFTPKFDVKEIDGAYQLHGEFPGVEQKNISIEWTDANTLTVSGKHEHVKEEGDYNQAIEGGEKHPHYEKPSVQDENAAEAQGQVAKNQAQGLTQRDGNSPRYWVHSKTVS
jgi:HSP20 family protein